MIKSIYLENWKTHLKSTLDFKKGSNIILGIIGSGKSSIVDAICYGLYGTFPTLSNRKVTLDETIMFKPTKKEHFKIILKLQQDEKTYVIEREVFLGSKANSAKVYLEEKLIAGPKKSDVDNFISQLLGIDYNLFIKVVYSQQNEIDYFLKIAPSKRKEQFDDLFGISHFENIKVSTREIERGLLFEKTKKEALLEQITNQLENIKIEQLKEKEKDVIEKLKAFLNKKIELKEKEKSLLEQLEKLKIIKEKYENNSLNYKIYASKIQEIEKELENKTIVLKEEIEKEKEKLLEFEKEITLKKEVNNKNILLKKEIENKILFYKKEVDLQENKRKENLKSIIVIDDFNLEKTNSLKKENIEKLDFAKNQKIKALLKIKELERSLEELSKGHSKCPVCSTPFSQEKLSNIKPEKEKELAFQKRIFKEKEEEIKEINNQENKLLELEKGFEKNQKIKDEIIILDQKIKEGFEKITELEKELEKIPQIIDLKEKEDKLKEIKEKTLEKEEIFKKYQRLQEYKESKEKYKKELEKQDFSQENYINLLSEHKTSSTTLKEVLEKEEIYKDMQKNLLKQIEDFEKLEENKKNIFKNLEKIEKNKQNISYFSKSLDLSQTQLRNVLVDNINQALNLIWPKIYPYKDYISARLNSKNDYILEVLTQRNEWIRVEGILSGGERACASLSIRIAISLILTKKLGLLILDEPTHNLDSFSIDALSNVIDTEMPDLVEQIFIVTHDKRLLETINANKYIIERDKENDSFSKVL